MLYSVTFINSTLLRCETPLRSEASKVALTLVSSSQFEFSELQIYFTYLDLQLLQDISPSEYHIIGGIDAILTGTFEMFE